MKNADRCYILEYADPMVVLVVGKAHSRLRTFFMLHNRTSPTLCHHLLQVVETVPDSGKSVVLGSFDFLLGYTYVLCIGASVR